ncbi:Protein MBOA-1 [Aphelenchoides avenae]|nr:Protein MBOA-1 [Aphelenchus avenae]
MTEADVLDDEYSPTTVVRKRDKQEDTPVPDKSASHRKKLMFKEKQFRVHESLLIAYADGPAGIVYNFFAAVFLLLTLGTLFRDAYEHGNPFYHCWLILWNFDQLPVTLFAWSVMFGSTVVFGFYGFRLWASIGAKAVTFNNQKPFVAAYVAYLVGLFYFSLKFLFEWKLNCACSFIITCENTRLAMKTHAFIRENIGRGASNKLKTALDGSASGNLPTLRQFVYFMFCPSFLYRDEYPRTEKCNWNIVAKHFAHCLGCIYITNLMFVNFIYPYFENLTYTGISWKFIVYSLFPSIIPGSMCLLMLFFGLLHSWLNMFAEALRFGDRLFYASWWSSRNMAEYYRDWNLVVHEWLYAYVYRDVATLIGGKRGLKVAQTVVFFLSAAFHEYWFGISLRLFYPVMFTLYFILGGIFFSLSRLIKVSYIWNIAMWFNLLIGTGMFVSSYALEWYARQRCPQAFENALLDQLIPRLWTC